MHGGRVCHYSYLVNVISDKFTTMAKVVVTEFVKGGSCYYFDKYIAVRCHFGPIQGGRDPLFEEPEFVTHCQMRTTPGDFVSFIKL